MQNSNGVATQLVGFNCNCH